MQYRSHRYRTQYPVQLFTPTGRQDCHMIDVNNTGGQILGSRDLRRGDKVKFRVLNHEVTGVVSWSRGEKAGLMFRPHISTMQVDTLRYRRDAVRNRPRGSVGFAFAEL